MSLFYLLFLLSLFPFSPTKAAISSLWSFYCFVFYMVEETRVKEKTTDHYPATIRSKSAEVATEGFNKPFYGWLRICPGVNTCLRWMLNSSPALGIKPFSKLLAALPQRHQAANPIGQVQSSYIYNGSSEDHETPFSQESPLKMFKIPSAIPDSLFKIQVRYDVCLFTYFYLYSSTSTYSSMKLCCGKSNLTLCG